MSGWSLGPARSSVSINQPGGWQTPASPIIPNTFQNRTHSWTPHADLWDHTADSASASNTLTTSETRSLGIGSLNENSKRVVNFVDGLSDGIDYVKELRESNPAEYKRRWDETYRPIEKREIEAVQGWKKQLGKKFTELDSDAACAKASRDAHYALRNSLQTEAGKPFDPPRSTAPDDTRDENDDWVIDELQEEAKARDGILGKQLMEMGSTVTSAQRDAILRGWLDATHGSEVAGVEMKGWAEKARPPPNQGWVTVSDADHTALGPIFLPVYRKIVASEGATLTDEELLAQHRTQKNRYMRISLDEDMMSTYPEGVQDALKSANSTSDSDKIDISLLTDSERSHITRLAEMQNSGESEEVIHRKMREYVEKHRKVPAYTVQESEEGTVVSFNRDDIEAGTVTASLPDGTQCSIRCRRPKEDKSIATDGVDTSGPNPFVARRGDDLAWRRHSMAWKNHQARKKKAQGMAMRVPKLGDYLVAESTSLSRSEGSSRSGIRLQDWAGRSMTSKGETSDQARVAAVFDALSIDARTESVGRKYGLDPDRASRLSMWAMDCMGKGWRFGNKSDSTAEVLTEQFPSMAADMKSLFTEAGIKMDDTPDKILHTIVDSDAPEPVSSWSGQDMEDWAAQPNPETSDSLPAHQALSRLISKHEVAQALHRRGITNVDRLSKLSTYTVDAAEGASLESSIQRVADRAVRESAWTPGPSDKDFSWMKSGEHSSKPAACEPGEPADPTAASETSEESGGSSAA